MLSPAILLSLSPKTLRTLVATFARGDLPRASSSPSGAFATARAFFTGAASFPASTESTLARFATPSGRLAIVEAGRATRDPRVPELLRSPAADVAAALAVERAVTKGRARRLADRLFALAAHRVERDLSRHPTYELLATPPLDGPARAPALVEERLRRALGGTLLDTWLTSDPDGTLRVALFLRRPTLVRLVVDEDGAVRQRTDAPVGIDLVAVSPDGARVAITTTMPELLPAYRAALGLSFRPSFTLRPLKDMTPAQLAAVSVPRVTRIAVVALRFRRPSGARIEVRADDALDPSLHPPRAGYVDRATIRFTLDGKHTVDAFLQLPYRLDLSDRAFEVPVRAALAALGIFAPGALPDDARSLAPYVHGDWRWRAVIGDADFERLMAQKRFLRTRASHVVSEEHRMHGAAYVVRGVPDDPDVHYALAEDPSLGAELVREKDRVAWRLDTSALQAAMRADLGAAAPDPSSAIVIDGVLDLGTVTLASGKIRFVYAMGTPPRGWLAAARRACGLGVTLVVLVPRGHGGAEGVLEIELDVAQQFGARPIGRVLGRAAEALGVEKEVEPWRLCDEEVVIDLGGESLWVAGVRVALTDMPWRFVEFLARRGGKVATTKEIGQYLSRSEYPDVAARRTKADVERRVREKLEAAGADADVALRLIVADGKRGYRFGVSVRVV
jgi:hypothetical protein